MSKPCIKCGRPTKSSRCRRCRPGQRAYGYDDDWNRRVREAIAKQPFCSTPGCTNMDLTGDHPVPLSKGGSKAQEPVVLCRACNGRKKHL